MARRELSAEEEAALVKQAEAQRGDAAAWGFERPHRVRRGRGATAVLSVRVPLAQLRELRSLAGARGLSLSELLQEAVGALAASGPRISFSANVKRATVYVKGRGGPASRIAEVSGDPYQAGRTGGVVVE